MKKYNVLITRDALRDLENLIRVLKVYSTKQDFARRIVSYFKEN